MFLLVSTVAAFIRLLYFRHAPKPDSHILALLCCNTILTTTLTVTISNSCTKLKYRRQFSFPGFAQQARNALVSLEGFETDSLVSFLEVSSSARSASDIRDKTTATSYLDTQKALTPITPPE
jgi:hypothetical protein